MAVTVMGIAGPSCGGKTTLARALRDHLGAERVLMIPLDNYYRDNRRLAYDERCALNYDAPEAIEHELLATHLAELSAGRAIVGPGYDFTTHLRLHEAEDLAPRPFIIVEGILALHWPQLRGLYDLSVYVDLVDTECRSRRERRDVRERGRTPESVKAQYDRTVAPMRALHVEPQREWADVIVDGAGDVRAAARDIAARLLW